jgi:hypothetical protein
MTCIVGRERKSQDFIMSWAALFWIVYGVGSTLFVVYLFRLGKNVASNRKELVQQEIERMRNEEVGQVEPSAKRYAKLDSRETVSDPVNRVHVQRIFQPDTDHVSVQGVRAGMTCVINLPVGQACVGANTQPDYGIQAEKAR